MSVAAVADPSESNPGEAQESIWNAGTIGEIQKFCKTVEDVKASREALTARLAADKAHFIDQGFNKESIDALLKYAALSDEKKENFDITWAFWRKAIGDPLQDDLFMAAMQQQVTVKKPVNKDDD